MMRLKFVMGLVSLMLVTLLGGLILSATALPLAMGWERVVLTSGSMQPMISPGDIVLASKPAHPVEPGTVVVFNNPNKPGSLITHRVVEQLPDGSYKTKGDANPQPDISPITQDNVIGEGALLVPTIGLPAIWAQQGHPTLVGAGAIVIFLLVWLSRYGLLTRHDPWLNPGNADQPDELEPGTKPAPKPGKPVLVAVSTLTAIVLVATATWTTLQPSHAAFSASTVNTGSVLATAAHYYLKTNGTTNTTSSATLPLSTTAPTLTTLYNYDTDRDILPGLKLNVGVGLHETESPKIQHWLMPANSPVTLEGTVKVTLWSAVKDFEATRTGSATVGLYDCNSTGGACVLLASSTVTSTGAWSPDGTWAAKGFNLGTINRQTTRLQLRVAANGPDPGLMFAYDTTTHPARITIGT